MPLTAVGFCSFATEQNEGFGIQKTRLYCEGLEDGPFMILGSGETVGGGGEPGRKNVSNYVLRRERGAG